MPVVITGDMTAEEIDQAIINDLNALVASSGAETIQVEHRSIARLLELLGDKGKPKEIKSEAKSATLATQYAGGKAAAPAAKPNRAALNDMTKEELVAYADDNDIDVTPSWPKADIVDAIVKHK
jgi:hypothetical protein